MFWTTFGLVTCLKLLLLPAYRSTDFEVHRNWLAITHSLPLSQWYVDETSEWTLDYPPMFAYFEYCLSHVAKLFDTDMLKVSNLNYASNNTILFQRLSVICTDIVFAFGAKRCIDQLTVNSKERVLLAINLLANFGLLLIDHIHFQYNGILFGILLVSVAKMMEEKFLQSALYFAILLNMKHIFVYVSPVYIVYLLKFYCGRSGSLSDASVKLIKLAMVTVGVTAASFGPFYDHIPQVLARLFPFKRGLCHAYWAPNFWAIYNVLDKVTASLVFRLPSNSSSSNTGGLVQEYDHQVLPSIRPTTTFVITALAMIPCIVKIVCQKYDRFSASRNFIRGIAICGCTSFMFGWHVHEKAILMTFIPLSLLATTNIFEARQTLLLSIIANYSLFPLLFQIELLPIKLSLYFMYTAAIAFNAYNLQKSRKLNDILPLHELIFVMGFAAIFAYENCLQFVLKLDQRLPFLPLLLTSLYSSIGIAYFWAKYYLVFLLYEAPTPSVG